MASLPLPSSLVQTKRALTIEEVKKVIALDAYESDKTNPVKKAQYNLVEAKVEVARCKVRVEETTAEGKAERLAEARARAEEMRKTHSSDSAEVSDPQDRGKKIEEEDVAAEHARAKAELEVEKAKLEVEKYTPDGRRARLAEAEDMLEELEKQADIGRKLRDAKGLLAEIKSENTAELLAFAERRLTTAKVNCEAAKNEAKRLEQVLDDGICASSAALLAAIEKTDLVNQALSVNALGFESLFHFKPTMYIRVAVHEPLWKSILEVLQNSVPERTHDVLLLGNPGTGKSAFVLYILWVLLRDANRPFDFVIYQNYTKEGHRLLLKLDSFETTIVHQLNEVVTRLQTHGKRVVYICDAGSMKKEPATVQAAPTLVVSSSDTTHFKTWKKERKPKSFYMPLWRIEELQAAIACHYGAKHTINVAANYDVAGGNMRLVDIADATETKRQISSAVAATDVKKIVEILQSPHDSMSTQASNKILHLSVPWDENSKSLNFSTFVMRFASPEVERLVGHKIADTWNNELVSLVVSLPVTMETAILKGWLFERVVHRKFREDGKFPIVCLDDRTCRTLSDPAFKIEQQIDGLFVTIPRLDYHQFESIELVDAQQAGTYWNPQLRSFEAVDALLPPSTCVQCTVASLTTSDGHPLKEHGLQVVKDHLVAAKGTIDVIFVIPAKDGLQLSMLVAQKIEAAKEEEDLASLTLAQLVSEMTKEDLWEVLKTEFAENGKSTVNPNQKFKKEFGDDKVDTLRTAVLAKAGGSEAALKAKCIDVLEARRTSGEPETKMGKRSAPMIRQWALLFG